MICPYCKKVFTPRTATQNVCGLKCLYEMKRGKRTESEPIVAGASVTNSRGGEGQVNQVIKHSSRQVAEGAITHDLKEWVMEAAGAGYLTEAQLITVVQSLTRSAGATGPGDVGIAELMQLIELALTGGLDDSDYGNRNTTSCITRLNRYQFSRHSPAVFGTAFHTLPVTAGY